MDPAIVTRQGPLEADLEFRELASGGETVSNLEAHLKYCGFKHAALNEAFRAMSGAMCLV